MSDAVLIAWLAGAVAAVGVLAAAWRVVRAVFRAVRRFVHFLDDWHGEPARDGVEARPGVLARVAAIEYELRPNNGKSLRDRVDATERLLKQVAEQVCPEKEA